MKKTDIITKITELVGDNYSITDSGREVYLSGVLENGEKCLLATFTTSMRPDTVEKIVSEIISKKIEEPEVEEAEEPEVDEPEVEEVEAEENRCCICGKLFKGFGNNPWPVKTGEAERCCDACNWDYVIPARLINLRRKSSEE